MLKKITFKKVSNENSSNQQPRYSSIYSVLSKQQRYAKDIRVYSYIVFIFVVAVMLFSFFIQNIFTDERNQGRDIRSTAGNMSTEIFKTRTHTTLFYLNNTESAKEISTFYLEENLLKKYHTYLSQHSIIKVANQKFFNQEQTYAIIINYVELFEHKIISESLTRLFISYTSTYESMLEAFQLCYTNLFASNNAATTMYNSAEVIAELLLMSLFFFKILFPAIKRFIQAAKQAEQTQNQLIETKSKVKEMQRENAEIYKLPFDVICVDYNRYRVAHHGKTVIVNYSEKYNMFICECDIFLKEKFCFHTNRAKWLRERIYQLKRHNSVH